VTNGQTASEQKLAGRGITTVGFDREFFFRTDGRVQAPDPTMQRVTHRGSTNEPWVQPGAIEPSIQTGPNLIDGGKLQEHIDAAESRVTERPNI
jgi:hypothetical protein